MSHSKISVMAILPESDYHIAQGLLPDMPLVADDYDEYAARIEHDRNVLHEAGQPSYMTWVFIDQFQEWAAGEGLSITDIASWRAYLTYLTQEREDLLVPFTDTVRAHLVRDQALALFEQLVGDGPLLEANMDLHRAKAMHLLGLINRGDGFYTLKIYVCEALQPDRAVDSMLQTQMLMRREDDAWITGDGVSDQGLAAVLACAHVAPGGVVMCEYTDEYDHTERYAYVIMSGQPHLAEFPE